jgi:hypothetical protein
MSKGSPVETVATTMSTWLAASATVARFNGGPGGVLGYQPAPILNLHMYASNLCCSRGAALLGVVTKWVSPLSGGHKVIRVHSEFVGQGPVAVSAHSQGLSALQAVAMHTRELHAALAYESAGPPVFCEQRGKRAPDHVGRRGARAHTLKCLVCKARDRLGMVVTWDTILCTSCGST